MQRSGGAGCLCSSEAEAVSLAGPGYCAPVIDDDMLRHAVLDPDVRKRRVFGRLAGVYVDAEDLRGALVERGVDPDGLDSRIKKLGGQRLNYRLLNALTGAVG